MHTPAFSTRRAASSSCPPAHQRSSHLVHKGHMTRRNGRLQRRIGAAGRHIPELRSCCPCRSHSRVFIGCACGGGRNGTARTCAAARCCGSRGGTPGRLEKRKAQSALRGLGLIKCVEPQLCRSDNQQTPHPFTNLLKDVGGVAACCCRRNGHILSSRDVPYRPSTPAEQQARAPAPAKRRKSSQCAKPLPHLPVFSVNSCFSSSLLHGQ